MVALFAIFFHFIYLHLENDVVLLARNPAKCELASFEPPSFVMFVRGVARHELWI
jgi:hypothetical protein